MRFNTRALLLISALVFTLASGCATSRIRSSDRRGMLDKSDHDSAQAARPLFKRSVKTVVQSSEMSDVRKVSLRRTTRSWRWPLENPQITSPFGARGGDPHDGVDLKAETGTPVFAAATGKVLYSGKRISGYGNIVILRHNNGLSSIYAHNSQILVKAGQTVREGQKIAFSGNTGRTTGPHVHFEIRDGTTPVNPVEVMPDAVSQRKPNRQIARAPTRSTSRKRKTRLN